MASCLPHPFICLWTPATRPATVEHLEDTRIHHSSNWYPQESVYILQLCQYEVEWHERVNPLNICNSTWRSHLLNRFSFRGGREHIGAHMGTWMDHQSIAGPHVSNIGIFILFNLWCTTIQTLKVFSMLLHCIAALLYRHLSTQGTNTAFWI